MQLVVGQRRPLGVDVALAIGDDGDGGGLFEHSAGMASRVQPALRLLVGELAPAVREGDPAGARPDLAADQA